MTYFYLFDQSCTLDAIALGERAGVRGFIGDRVIPATCTKGLEINK
jgi:hypothetical protein